MFMSRFARALWWSTVKTLCRLWNGFCNTWSRRCRYYQSHTACQRTRI